MLFKKGLSKSLSSIYGSTLFIIYHESTHVLHQTHTIIKLDQGELKTFPIFSCYFRVVFFQSTLHASMIIKQKQINRQSLTNPFFFT